MYSRVVLFEVVQSFYERKCENMNILISLLGPSLLGIKFFSSLNKKLSNRDVLIYYGMFTFIINTLTILIFYLLFGIEGDIALLLKESAVFFLKYTLISVLVMIIVVSIVDIINKNVQIKFEVIKDEENK